MTAADTRSRRGDGTKPRQRGPHSWEARYRHPTEGRKSVWGKTEDEAWEALRKAQVDAAGGLPPLDRRTSVESVLRRHIEAREEAGAAANTLANYRCVLRRVRHDPIAGKKVHTLQADDVVDLLARWRKAGLANSTRRQYASMLSAAIGAQVKRGRVHRNVAADVELPKGEEAATIPTKAEVRAIMDAAHEYHYAAAIVLPLFAGLRLGEVCGLRWGDIRPQVDRFGQVVPGTLAIHVARNYARATGPEGVPAAPGRTKSKAGRRQVPITGSPVLVYLWALRDLTHGEGVIPHPDAWIFPSTRKPGAPLSTRGLDGAWKAVRRRAKVRPMLRYHDLRHAYAVELLDKGVPMETVSVLLGHSDIGVTARVYGHRDTAVHTIPADLWATAGAV